MTFLKPWSCPPGVLVSSPIAHPVQSHEGRLPTHGTLLLKNTHRLLLPRAEDSMGPRGTPGDSRAPLFGLASFPVAPGSSLAGLQVPATRLVIEAFPDHVFKMTALRHLLLSTCTQHSLFSSCGSSPTSHHLAADLYLVHCLSLHTAREFVLVFFFPAVPTAPRTGSGTE